MEADWPSCFRTIGDVVITEASSPTFGGKELSKRPEQKRPGLSTQWKPAAWHYFSPGTAASVEPSNNDLGCGRAAAAKEPNNDIPASKTIRASSQEECHFSHPCREKKRKKTKNKIKKRKRDKKEKKSLISSD